MWKHVGAVVLLLATLVQAQENCTKSFLCDETYCKGPCGPKDCKAPDGKECDGIRLPLYTNPSEFCACCADNKKCVTYLKEGDSCESTSDVYYPNLMCGPRLRCDNRRCKPMDTACMKQVTDMESSGQGMNQSSPDCDDEGYFAPVQCQPGGLCRCVDKETGEPVALGFGVAAGIGEADSVNMDCLCARQYHESLKVGCEMKVHRSDFKTKDDWETAYKSCLASASTKSAILLSPEDEKSVYFGQGHMRCLPNGNFDQIQCFDRLGTNGVCYCVKVDTTGLSFNGSYVVIEETEELECFDPEFHLEDYYRPCEKKLHQLKKEKASLLKHGRHYIPKEIPPVCTPDGFYAKLQTRAGDVDQLYCADRDGEQIEGYAGIRTELAGRKMNCECALTRKYLSVGSVKPACCLNGNFRGKQCVSGLCFCVDQYGRQQGIEVDQMEADTLKCMDFCCDGTATEGDPEFCDS